MFADNTVLTAHSKEDIQQITSLSAETMTAFGLRINMHKTELLYLPCKLEPQTHNDVKMVDTAMANASRFAHLGSTVTSDGKLDIKLQTHMAKASATFVDSMSDYGETRVSPPR